MNVEWLARQTMSPEARRRYEQERLVLWVTDMISQVIGETRMFPKDLARTLGTSAPDVTALLNGECDITLRTLADLAYALDRRVEITLQPLRKSGVKDLAYYLTVPWTVRLFEQHDDGVYHVITVEELPGFSVVGDTREAVIAEYPIALRCYLEGCINAGEEPPLPAAVAGAG